MSLSNRLQIALKGPGYQSFTVDNVIAHLTEAKHIPLTDKQQRKLAKSMKSHSLLAEIAGEMEVLLLLKDNLGISAGLTDKDLSYLQKLIAKRKKLKDAFYANELKVADYRKLLEIEKELIPYDEHTKHWLQQTEKLNQSLTWRQATEQLQRTNVINEPGQTLLNSIQDSWKQQHQFALMSNGQLIDLDNCLQTLERQITALLAINNVDLMLIQSYCAEVINHTATIRRQLIFAMLYRLKCAEYFYDLHCDDIIQYTDALIQQAIAKESEMQEPLRRGMTIYMVKQFLNAISTYFYRHTSDEMIAKAFNSLVMRQPPHHWRATDRFEQQLLKNPTVVYFANTFPQLLSNIAKTSDLVTTIFSSDSIHDKSFLLNLLNRLSKDTKRELENLSAEDRNKNSHLYRSLQTKLDDYQELVAAIQMQLNQSMQTSMQTLLDDIFDKNNPNSDKIQFIGKCIQNVNVFNARFLGAGYTAQNDVILSVGERIRQMIFKNESLSQQQASQLATLMSKIFPDIDSEYAERIHAAYQQLPKQVAEADKTQLNGLLHYIIAKLEQPLLQNRYYHLAIKRHQHIATHQHERWEKFEDTMLVSEDELIAKIDYLRNVSLMTLLLDRHINLDNFDCNETTSLIDTIQSDINLIDNCPNELHALIKAARNQIANCITKQLARQDVINDYLQDHNHHYLDLHQLQDLNARLHEFYHDNVSLTSMLAAIEKTIRLAAKNYIIACIRGQAVWDSKYLLGINEALHYDIIDLLQVDPDIEKTLLQAIMETNGDASYLGAILTVFISADSVTHYASALNVYSTKRLSRIEMDHSINESDYQFFASHPQSEGFNTFVRKKNLAIRFTEMTAWNDKTARLIELIGDRDTIINYRLKRITELLSLCYYSETDRVPTHEPFLDFSSTINQRFLIDGKVIPPTSLLASGQDVKAAITDLLINRWSPLVDYLAYICGAESETATLHTETLLHYLSTHHDFSREWLGQQITNNHRLLEHCHLTESAIVAASKQFYLDLLGETNIPIIINYVDDAINKLANINIKQYLNSQPPSSIDELWSFIQSIQPLETFHRLFSTETSHQKTFAAMQKFKQAIALHEMKKSIAKQVVNLKTATDTRNICISLSSLTDLLALTYERNLLNDDNVTDFIAYLNDELSAQLTLLLSQPYAKQYVVLATLYHLLMEMTSEQLKMHLIAQHSQAITDSQKLVAIINKLGANESLPLIQQFIGSSILMSQGGNHIQYLFKYANKMAQLSLDARQRIHTVILLQAAITQDQGIDQATNVQLLTLWQQTAAILNKEAANPPIQPSYIHFLLQPLIQTTDLLLHRAIKEPELMKKLTMLFPQIAIMRHALETTLNQRRDISNTFITQTLVHQSVSTDVILQPLYISINKVYALAAVQKLIDYLNKSILSSTQIIAYEKLIAMQSFIKINLQTYLPTLEIKEAIGIRKDHDAVKVIHLILIHHLFADIYQTGELNERLKNELDRIMQSIERYSFLKNSKSFMQIITTLQHIGNDMLAPAADRQFASVAIRPATYNRFPMRFFSRQNPRQTKKEEYAHAQKTM